METTGAICIVDLSGKSIEWHHCDAGCTGGEQRVAASLGGQIETELSNLDASLLTASTKGGSRRSTSMSKRSKICSSAGLRELGSEWKSRAFGSDYRPTATVQRDD